MSPRPYDNSRRSADAEATRARILDAAEEMLSSPEGATAFALDAVARRAGVARMTVYYQFTGRKGLLEALFDRKAATLMHGLPLAFRAEDPREGLKILVATFCAFWAEDHTGMRRLLGAVGQDPEIAESIRERTERRRTAIRTLVGRMNLADPAGLTDLLFALTSAGAWNDIAAAGRPPEEVEALMQAAVAATIDAFARAAPPQQA